MEILKALKFVKNGYARKDLIPELTHYSIRNKRVTAYNGSLAFSSPINLDLDIAPVALHFHKCIEACEDTISLTIEKGDKLRIKSGKFKSLVRCLPTVKVPTIIPRGKRFDLPSNFVENVSSLLPILENESERPYTQGLNLIGKSAFATNNIVMVELWLGVDLPNITIPKKAIQEICKYKKEIDHVLIDHDMIYFIYNDERWIASKLLLVDCPDFTKVLNRAAQAVIPPDDFWPCLAILSRFTDEAGKVTLEPGRMLAGELASDSEPLASMDCEGLEMQEPCLFNINQLLKIKDLVKTIEFKHGSACLFFGDAVRGAIVGYRK
jgi:DNA polymerase III sliding clamp (beta) subunit (PCNA family)